MTKNATEAAHEATDDSRAICALMLTELVYYTAQDMTSNFEQKYANVVKMA